MAKDPFAEFNAEPVSASTVPQTSAGANVLMRVVSGVALLALLGLAFGYYVPLRRAHTALNNKYQAKNSELGGLTDQLKKTTDQLVLAQSERDSLKEDAEALEQVGKAQGESVQKLTGELEQALARLVKAKQVSVQTRGAASVITIDDRHVFGKRDTSPSRAGAKLLCEVGKAVKAVSVPSDVSVSGHTSSNKVSDPVLKRDFPSVWQLSAVRAAGALSELEACGVKGDRMRAVGHAHTRPDEGSAKGSTGEIRISLEPSKR